MRSLIVVLVAILLLAVQPANAAVVVAVSITVDSLDGVAVPGEGLRLNILDGGPYDCDRFVNPLPNNQIVFKSNGTPGHDGIYNPIFVNALLGPNSCGFRGYDGPLDGFAGIRGTVQGVSLPGPGFKGILTDVVVTRGPGPATFVRLTPSVQSVGWTGGFMVDNVRGAFSKGVSNGLCPLGAPGVSPFDSALFQGYANGVPIPLPGGNVVAPVALSPIFPGPTGHGPFFFGPSPLPLAAMRISADVVVTLINNGDCLFLPNSEDFDAAESLADIPPEDIPPQPVGGTTELLVGGGDPAASAAGGGDGDAPYAAIAGGAAVLLAMAGGGWFVRRRWVRSRAA